MRSGDIGHSWHWTIRLHARSLHQKWSRVYRDVFAHKSSDVPRYHDDAKRHQSSKGQPTSSNTSSRQQTWSRMPKRSFHWRRWVKILKELKSFLQWYLYLGHALAEMWGCPFIEASAKSRINVNEVFSIIVREMNTSSEKRNKKSRYCCCTIL